MSFRIGQLLQPRNHDDPSFVNHPLAVVTALVIDEKGLNVEFTHYDDPGLYERMPVNEAMHRLVSFE